MDSECGRRIVYTLSMWQSILSRLPSESSIHLTTSLRPTGFTIMSFTLRLGLMSVIPRHLQAHAGMTSRGRHLFRLSGDKGYTPARRGRRPLYGNAVAAAANNIPLGTVTAASTLATASPRAVCRDVYRYARYKGHDVWPPDIDVNSYSDAADISNYALDALRWALGAEIVRGDGNRNLNPRAEASRAEVSAMLQRFIERFA